MNRQRMNKLIHALIKQTASLDTQPPMSRTPASTGIVFFLLASFELTMRILISEFHFSIEVSATFQRFPSFSTNFVVFIDQRLHFPQIK